MAFLRLACFQLIAGFALLFAFASASATTASPAMAEMAGMAMPSDMNQGERDCHDRKSADRCALSACGMLCQAVPPITPIVMVPLRDHQTYWTVIRRQNSSEFAPETPPPRGA